MYCFLQNTSSPLLNILGFMHSRARERKARCLQFGGCQFHFIQKPFRLFSKWSTSQSQEIFFTLSLFLLLDPFWLQKSCDTLEHKARAIMYNLPSFSKLLPFYSFPFHYSHKIYCFDNCGTQTARCGNSFLHLEDLEQINK